MHPNEEKLIRLEVAMSRDRHHHIDKSQFERWKCANCGRERHDYKRKDHDFPDGVYQVIDGKPYCSSRCVREATHSKLKKVTGSKARPESETHRSFLR